LESFKKKNRKIEKEERRMGTSFVLSLNDEEILPIEYSPPHYWLSAHWPGED
jgi:hypothetical protein